MPLYSRDSNQNIEDEAIKTEGRTWFDAVTAAYLTGEEDSYLESHSFLIWTLGKIEAPMSTEVPGIKPFSLPVNTPSSRAAFHSAMALTIP